GDHHAPRWRPDVIEPDEPTVRESLLHRSAMIAPSLEFGSEWSQHTIGPVGTKQKQQHMPEADGWRDPEPRSRCPPPDRDPRRTAISGDAALVRVVLDQSLT